MHLCHAYPRPTNYRLGAVCLSVQCRTLKISAKKQQQKTDKLPQRHKVIKIIKLCGSQIKGGLNKKKLLALQDIYK